MSTYQQALDAKRPAVDLFERLAVKATVGISRSERWNDRPSQAKKEERAGLATDYVLAVRLQEKTDQELPDTIEGIPVEYMTIDVPELHRL